MSGQLEPKTVYRAKWGVLEVYETFLLMQPTADAGSYLYESYGWVNEIQGRHFDRAYGYLVNRLHRNASSPAHYAQARKEVPLWRAFAVVSDSSAAQSIFDIETLALKGMPCRLFLDLENAKLWIDEEIRKIRGEG